MVVKQYNTLVLFRTHGQLENSRYLYVVIGVAMENIIEQLTVKRVTSEDYDKVMAIRGPEDVYNGHDYLPSYFNSLIDSSNVMAFVVVHGDEFVRH
jgi:hypothetical protein